MNISGTTSTCPIVMANTQFIKSGLTLTNASTIIITDGKGMDVSDCYNITTNITTFDSNSGETCNTSLEIEIGDPDIKVVECLFTGFTQQSDGLILLEYPDGVTTLNAHPDCCNSLGFTSEMGVDNYYVCRWRALIDLTDCINYTATIFDENGYMIYDVTGDGQTIIVPSPECCGDLTDHMVVGGYNCYEEVILDCGALVLIEPVPAFGDIFFNNPVTGLPTAIVEFSECCTLNGFNFKIVTGGFTCYKSIAVVKPTVSVTMQASCCKHVVTTTTTTTTTTPISVTSVAGYMEPCIGGTIDDTMGAAVTINTPATFDIRFGVDVFYAPLGGICNSFAQSYHFEVVIIAGQFSSDFEACYEGQTIPNGAKICSACITDVDNPNVNLGSFGC